MLKTDEKFMQQALNEAYTAFEKDEVPIGAVIVCQDRIIARGHNLTQTLNDPTAHAEMQAITAACNYLGSKYLTDCTLYVTVEPCAMCAAATHWAQLPRIVYGCKEPKFGYSKLTPSCLHPKTQITEGILETECSNLMRDFFSQKRN